MNYKIWFKSGWSFFAMIGVVIISILVLRYCAYSEKTYKSLSLFAQIIGAILVLVSININIKTVENKSIFSHILEWFKSFPLFSKSVVVDINGVTAVSSVGKVTAFGENNFETLEQKVEYLLNECKNIHSKIEKNDLEVNERITNETKQIHEKTNQNHEVVQNLSLKISEIYGSLNLPIFGVMLIIYATIMGAIPDIRK